jgi:hypothetical protein
MEQFDWKLMLHEWQITYYTYLLMLLSSLAVLLKAVRTQPFNGVTRIIGVYAAASFLQSLLANIIYFNIDSVLLNAFVSNSISLFIVLEITCCYLLVATAPTTQAQHWAMRGLLIGYYLFAAIFLYGVFHKKRVNNIESLIEMPLLIIYCGIYYYNVLIGLPPQGLARSPLFWAMAGFALLAFAQIPYNIVYHNMNTISKGSAVALTINYISYCLLFVCLWRAIHITPKTNTHERI